MCGKEMQRIDCQRNGGRDRTVLFKFASDRMRSTKKLGQREKEDGAAGMLVFMYDGSACRGM